MKFKTAFSGLLIALLASTQVAFALTSTASGSPLTPPITGPSTTPTPIPNEFTNLSASMPYPGNATFNFTYNGSASYFYVNASTLQDMSWDVYLKFAEGSANPISLTNPTKWDKYSCGRTLYWRVESILGEKSQIQSTTINCSSAIPVGTFSNLSANLTSDSAYFNFTYSGPSTPNYHIDMSTYQDMSWDVYMGFASNNNAPVSLANPQAKWDKYSCGRTLYWRAYDASRRSVSSIQTATVVCTTPAPSTRVFVTSTTYSGNLGGLTGADTKCQARANAANLGGTWKAWLSDASTSASLRLNHSNNPYKLLNGTTVANNWADLVDGSLQNGITITESGTTSYPGVRTGTNFDGSTAGPNNAYTCVDWLTDYNGASAAMGVAGMKDFRWTSSNAYGCSAPLALYCFEQPASASQSATPSANLIATPVAAMPVPIKIINGNINYRITKTIKAGRYTRTVNATVPASGVTVEATNLSTGEKFTAKTNLLGRYSLKANLGKYSVRVYDTRKTTFNPNNRLVNVYNNIGGISFQGFLNTIRFW